MNNLNDVAMAPEDLMMIQNLFEGQSKLINAQFDNVHDKLENIEKQTIKTNGRVTALEQKQVINEKEFIDVKNTLDRRIRVFIWVDKHWKLVILLGVAAWLAIDLISTCVGWVELIKLAK